MKIKDIINKVDKSKQFEDKVYIGDIAREMDLFNIENYDDQIRLISYYIGNWYCTDSYVGYKVYFFDNEPVAVSSQTGRKMNEEIEWVSKEAYKKVRDYVLTFAEEFEPVIRLTNMDEDIGETYKISFNGQLFDYHKEIPLYNGENVKIIDTEEKSKENFNGQITKKVLISHEAFGKTEWVNVGQLDFPYNLIK